MVAHLADPTFNGAIRYDAPDDCVPIGGNGVEVFVAGTRNPFGIYLHSNMGYIFTLTAICMLRTMVLMLGMVI